jgi:predicted DNA-binding WGR domain protein
LFRVRSLFFYGGKVVAKAKVKVWKAKDSGQPSFSSSYEVTKRWEGNCSDVVKNSNKFYHAEIQVAPDGAARIFTMYGRVGVANPAREYRYYPFESACFKDFESLVKKKRDRKKDPYREVDLAITAIGSDGAKEIKKSMTGLKGKPKEVQFESKLDKEVQRLVKQWFGDTGHFIEMSLKCPLGQLTKEQIDKGRDVLDECRRRVNAKSKTDTAMWDTLTSQFYSLIPHVLPRKINPVDLRISTIDRIMEKSDTLDTFLDAKNVESVLKKGSSVDAKYAKLKADLEWISPEDRVAKWVTKLVFETRAKNHAFLGNIKVFNIFRLGRNGESGHFDETLQKIASKVSGRGMRPKFTTLDRADLGKSEKELFSQANVWPLWHGTKPQNMVGIITRGLLIRPAGAAYTGSMFGDALYHAESSSKSMNYTGCMGSFYTGGSSDKRAFLFLEDVIVGNPHVVTRSHFFRKPPSGCHSVYAVPGGGLYNSENMTYASSGMGQQHRLKYIVEFQTRR